VGKAEYFYSLGEGASNCLVVGEGLSPSAV